jgi:S-adenosylmethionine:tRNA ribosyltransferase-isomerase
VAFQYELPRELIAQRPVEGDRSQARMLHYRHPFTIRDRHVSELTDILRPGDLLVLNDTKVHASRFLLNGELEEVFLLNHLEANRFIALARPLKKCREGMELQLSANLRCRVLKVGEGDVTVEVFRKDRAAHVAETIANEGLVPIPPYIRGGQSDVNDRESYQTVFAENVGSIAAPTAALHFTEALLRALEESGVEICYLTLHVGASSILSVERQLHSGGVGEESFAIPMKTFEALKRAKSFGRRIVAVGTTVTRALESLSDGDWRGDYDFSFRKTKLFIQPGFAFKTINSLMTNFHQSGSTHLALVSAFCGIESVKLAYAHAISERYRFFSYGDSCFFEGVS